MVVLITTIWKGTAVIQAIKSFSPTKIYFVVDDPLEATRKSAMGMIKDIFPQIQYHEVSAKIYDIVGMARAAIDIINKENGEKIIVHISEGRKTMSFGLLFAAYVKKESIDSVYYITEETNTLIQLPLVELKLSKQKKELLQKINEGVSSVSDLEKALNIKTPTVYVHMKELRDDGFLNKENQITEIGRIVLLSDTKYTGANQKSREMAK
jgi:CRISPR locus-related DNA-binding protein